MERAAATAARVEEHMQPLVKIQPETAALTEETAGQHIQVGEHFTLVEQDREPPLAILEKRPERFALAAEEAARATTLHQATGATAAREAPAAGEKDIRWMEPRQAMGFQTLAAAEAGPMANRHSPGGPD